MQLNLTDPKFEYLDPTPDIYALFVEYNKLFFYSKLDAVIVKWSNRMTLCAGLCRYKEQAGCEIVLSQPILKLRLRKDLIETLLHEMIHAYLFVTHNYMDRDSHGPNFQSHMYRINAIAQTNITIYHSFHREVEEYRRHWWRCQGPCQHQAPYYGIVKRAMNRAPGSYDHWWANHVINCGGTFVKICSPPVPALSQKDTKKHNKSTKNGSKTSQIATNSESNVQNNISNKDGQRLIDSYIDTNNNGKRVNTDSNSFTWFDNPGAHIQSFHIHQVETKSQYNNAHPKFTKSSDQIPKTSNSPKKLSSHLISEYITISPTKSLTYGNATSPSKINSSLNGKKRLIIPDDNSNILPYTKKHCKDIDATVDFYRSTNNLLKQLHLDKRNHHSNSSLLPATTSKFSQPKNKNIEIITID